VYAAAGGGTPDYTYEWENLCTGSTVNTTTWGGLNPCDYQITVVDDNGCVLTQIITLDSLNPIADFTITSDQLNSALEGTAVVCATFTNISQNFSNPIDPLSDTTFFWNLDTPNASWLLTHDFFQTFDTCYADEGQYEICLVAQNKNGCVDTACKTITAFTPPVIVAPNVFSPDGDGVNDVYTFDYLAKGIAEFHCVIVNRWGVIMAEINDVSTGWNGTDKSGSTCTDGVYFFTWEAIADNGEEMAGQGTVQIIGGK
jgi:gliding motility-associated-like protein